MKKWLRRIRGAIGMGLTWAAGWALAGVLIRVASILLPFLPVFCCERSNLNAASQPPLPQLSAFGSSNALLGVSQPRAWSNAILDHGLLSRDGHKECPYSVGQLARLLPRNAVRAVRQVKYPRSRNESTNLFEYSGRKELVAINLDY